MEENNKPIDKVEEDNNKDVKDEGAPDIEDNINGETISFEKVKKLIIDEIDKKFENKFPSMDKLNELKNQLMEKIDKTNGAKRIIFDGPQPILEAPKEKKYEDKLKELFNKK